MKFMVNWIALFALSIARCHAANNSIEVGSSLRKGDSWYSPSKSFSFGLCPSGNDASKLVLAIRYSDGTAVWSAMVAGQTQELQVSQNAEVTLERSGLVVKDGGNVKWRSGDGTMVISSAVLLDTGNFAILSSGSNKSYAWSSFDNPTHTLLSGQELVGDRVLVSGAYRLRLEKKQALLESLNFKPPNSVNSRKSHVNYWALQTENSAAVSSHEDSRLNLSSSGVLSFFDATGKSRTDDDSQDNLPASCRNFLRSESTIRYAIDYESSSVRMRRLKLETTGNLVMYSFSQGSWTKVWQAMLNECEIYATCGPFGICTFRPTRSCTCPPGFHHVNQNDDTSGCEHNVPMEGCSLPTRLVSVSRAHYEYGNQQISNEQNLEVLSMEKCKSSCLTDCQCVAAEYKVDGTAVCYKKIGKLYNGRQTIGGDSHAVVFIKLAQSDTQAVSDASDPYVTNVSASNPDVIIKKSISIFTVHVVAFVTALALLVLVIAFAITIALLWYRDRAQLLRRHMIDIEGAPVNFSYKELQAATSNFSEKLGSGGFGTVYKGVLGDKRVVAVKELQGVSQVTEAQFKVEVSTIAKIHHVNLVRLLGYCAEGDHRLLVLEYMPNGSLEKLIFSKSSNDNSTGIESFFCDWKTRFSIALGVARGVSYLHEECEECILHCDIKPHNILLGDDFSPKLSDFGMAKLVTKERVLSVTTIRGTRGYIAPEWLSYSQITPKVDVYSFGMVLMEILSGRDVSTLTPSTADNGVWSFPSLAFHKLMESDLSSIIDPRFTSGDPVDWRQVERVVKVALWCIQLDASVRPNMRKVVQMLEDTDVEVPPPPFPVFDSDAFVMPDLRGNTPDDLSVLTAR